MYEIPEVKQIVPSTIVGIDLGIKKHLTLLDNTIYDNNKYIEKYEKKIKRVQRQLKYKAKKIYGVSTYFPSSQLCSVCNKKIPNIKTKVKGIICCNQLDRDLNASINVMFE